MPEYTAPNEVRWVWNNKFDISIVRNGMAENYVRVDNIPLHHLKELSAQFHHDYIKVPYLIHGNELQFLFDIKTKTIFVTGKIEDRRRKGYRHELIIPLEEFDKAIQEIERSEYGS